MSPPPVKPKLVRLGKSTSLIPESVSLAVAATLKLPVALPQLFAVPVVLYQALLALTYSQVVVPPAVIEAIETFGLVLSSLIVTVLAGLSVLPRLSLEKKLI